MKRIITYLFNNRVHSESEDCMICNSLKASGRDCSDFIKFPDYQIEISEYVKKYGGKNYVLLKYQKIDRNHWKFCIRIIY